MSLANSTANPRNCAITRRTARGAAAAAVALVLTACSSAPDLTHTGFLADYSRLEPVNDTRMRYVNPELRTYTSFIIDPVQMRSEDRLNDEERAEVAHHFNEALAKMLAQRGYTVTQSAGPATGRIRIAITGVTSSTWWKKLHPATRMAGAGRGGAAMEGEIIDSVTGEQVAAVVQAGSGSQFTIGNLSTAADIKNVIDQWVAHAGDRLDELRATGR